MLEPENKQISNSALFRLHQMMNVGVNEIHQSAFEPTVGKEIGCIT